MEIWWVSGKYIQEYYAYELGEREPDNKSELGFQIVINDNSDLLPNQKIRE